MKPDQSSNFRRYTFVTAVLGLDPVGKLGLSSADYRVSVIVPMFCSFISSIESVCVLLTLLLLCSRCFSLHTYESLRLGISLQISYRVAREQFSNRLRETFLVLDDDEPRPVAQLEAGGLSLRDPRPGGREPGQKHRRESDSMSVSSNASAKKQDRTRSSEKRK